MRAFNQFRRLVGDQTGNAAIIFSLMSVPVILFAGGGVDLMMKERDRVFVQDTLDAAVVAAAALSQPLSADQTVRNYFQAAGLGAYTLTVTEERTVVQRKVSATATSTRATNFLKLAKVNQLSIKASAAAMEAYRNIELSFVLDLSGSMRGSRITAMRPAAKNFIGKLLADTAKDYTSISVIPYAGQVNVGFKAFDAFANSPTYRKHDKSSCFGNTELSYSGAIPDYSKAEHVPQFSTWLAGTNVGFDPWNCPTEETSISYLSNDAAALQARIDDYHMFDGTATQIAMKWGLHLLSPEVKPLLNKGKTAGAFAIPAAFADRPAPFDDKGTLKVIVLMTDGEVVAQQRPKSNEPVNEQPTAGGTNKQVVSQGQALNMMVAACDDAKTRGVIVYTIGFETNSADSAFLQKLKGCASSPDKFYEARTTDISKIFDNVVRSIYPLRLTH